MSAFSRDDSHDWDDGWSRVPHGLWTLPMTPGPKILLGWLHSHSNAFLARVTMSQCRRQVGSSSIFGWFEVLEQAGFIEIAEKVNGKASRITLKTAPWRALINQRDQSEIGSVTSPKSDYIEDQGEDHASSLRSEDSNESVRVDTQETEYQHINRVVKEYWEWYQAEHDGLDPTIEFPALQAVVKRLLKSHHLDDEIVDAMKTARAWTAKALADEIARKRALAEERTTTVAIPHSIVRAFGKAKPFFGRHAVISWPLERDLMVRCASLMARGFGVGETMIRLALALRVDDWNQWSLANVDCPRFSGELDDYADAMERAWVNRRWSVR